jgi:hypothetical protein
MFFLRNGNEIYGGMLPDLFNYMFDNPTVLAVMQDATHHNFQPVWSSSKKELERSVAFGLLSHDDTWGADFTAHHAGRTYGKNDGYVVKKAMDLLAIAPFPPELVSLGLDPSIQLELAHEFVENAVDILMKRRDPLIGLKIAGSALARSPDAAKLLTKAYANAYKDYFGGYDNAVFAITAVESEFRKSLVQYGRVLMQNENTAAQLLSNQTAALAKAYLEVYGTTLPLTEAEIAAIVLQYTQAAMQICAPDFAKEVEATISFVGKNMNSHHILYRMEVAENRSENATVSIAPAEYGLAQNYPNPFNPTTTIHYSLPRQSNVVLKVYDVVGREVRTLVQDTKDAGEYEVRFDASALPSGTYIYRLQAVDPSSGQGFVETKRLQLLK